MQCYGFTRSHDPSHYLLVKFGFHFVPTKRSSYVYLDAGRSYSSRIQFGSTFRPRLSTTSAYYVLTTADCRLTTVDCRLIPTNLLTY